MPLQQGTWSANLNGVQTQLKITGVDAQGRVNGSWSSTDGWGFWDEDAQRLTFFVWPHLLVGYLFTDPINLTGVNGTVIFTLAGSFETFPDPAAGEFPSAKRSNFGWYAQIGVD